jgi:F420-0:gamma-glutamyl ligase
MSEVTIIPISGLPEISEGDSLANLTHDVLKKSGREILDGDIFVVTQNIVLKIC